MKRRRSLESRARSLLLINGRAAAVEINMPYANPGKKRADARNAIGKDADKKKQYKKLRQKLSNRIDDKICQLKIEILIEK